MAYQPRQGDIIYMEFSPQTGHEQAGARHGLVVSNDAFFKRTKLAVVCPISTVNKGFPLHVPLDTRTKTTGVIKCEQCKSLDIVARNAAHIEKLPSDLLAIVLRNIKLFF